LHNRALRIISERGEDAEHQLARRRGCQGSTSCHDLRQTDLRFSGADTLISELVERFDPDQYGVGESASGVATPFEDEHDDE
jgi:hypothetical protein